jgi:bifunctional UDP-N-acetylglucosamine pyrophosphorylase/glucosamine-1-phosphate N-acetyltransferase
VIEKPAQAERLSNISCLPMYVFNEEIFSALEQTAPSKRGEKEILTAVQYLIDRRKRVSAAAASERMQVTTLDDLLSLSLSLFPRESRIDRAARVDSKAVINAPVIIESGAEIGEGAIIGPRALIERGARVEAGASVRDCIIGRAVRVPGGARVHMKAKF